MGRVALALVLVVCAIPACADPEPPPAAIDYDEARHRLEERRVALARELPRHPKETIRSARELLVRTLRDEILPAWNGTEWAMDGTSVVPREGSIACGYFVSTTLLHAGFRVERARLGQQASEHITRSLVTTAPIWHTSDQPIDAFLERLRRGGDGIYLVGLDNHVGFVIVDGDATWFHHAAPGVVRREPARTASFLSTSHYRESAKLFDDALVETWLRGTPIHTYVPRPGRSAR